MKEKAAVEGDLHGNAVGKLFVRGGELEQIVRSFFKTSPELFQGIDRWSSFTTCNGTEVSGTEITEFRSGFVGKITAVADAENGGRKFLGEHDEPSPSV